VDRIFVSARDGTGVPALREHLAQWALQRSCTTPPNPHDFDPNDPRAH
jgi:hypothetical protein